MIETSGEGGSAWLTPPLGGINSSLKEREREISATNIMQCTGSKPVAGENLSHDILTLQQINNSSSVKIKYCSIQITSLSQDAKSVNAEDPQSDAEYMICILLRKVEH